MAPAKNAGNVRGQMLRDLREHKGRELGHPLRQKDAAEAIGVTETAYQRWEANGPISGGHLQRLARYYKAKPGELIQVDGTPGKAKGKTSPPTQLDRIETAIGALTLHLTELAAAVEKSLSSPGRQSDDAAAADRRRRAG